MHTRLRKALTGALMVLGTVMATMVVAAPAQAAEYYQFINYNSEKCLAIGGGDQANGAHAIQWTCSAVKTEQQWIYDSAYRIRNRYTDKCLAIANSSQARGAHVIQWTCTMNENQRWDMEVDDMYQNAATGQCLAVGDSSKANGAHVVQWTCHDTPERQWVIW